MEEDRNGGRKGGAKRKRDKEEEKKEGGEGGYPGEGRVKSESRHVTGGEAVYSVWRCYANNYQRYECVLTIKTRYDADHNFSEMFQ